MSPRTRQTVAWAVAIATLGGVFALYTRPTILVTVSELIWACFN